jgi:maltoporin
MDEIDRAYLSHIKKGRRNPNWKGGKSRSRNEYSSAGWLPFGKDNPMWKGGRTISREGYVLIKDWNHPRTHANGYVLEHIKVLEQKLQRPLAKNEVTHHINGNKMDNRPENLEAVNRAHHITYHHLGASYAKHIEKVTVCSICGSSKTKMNFKKNKIDKYPLWLYTPGHKHDNDYALCQTCWTRYNRARKKEVSYQE